MTSHDLARVLRGMADLLDSKPVFPMPSYYGNSNLSRFGKLRYFGEKDAFIAAAKALGTFTKKYTADELIISCPANGGGEITLEIERNAVCRIVKPAQPAEYECDPLLSPEEDAEIGGAA